MLGTDASNLSEIIKSQSTGIYTYINKHFNFYYKLAAASAI